MRSLVATLVALAALLALSSTAFATVHPVQSSECSSDSAAGTPADTQDPYGITPGDGKGPDSNVARPLFAIFGPGPSQDPHSADFSVFPPTLSGPALSGSSGTEACPNA